MGATPRTLPPQLNTPTPITAPPAQTPTAQTFNRAGAYSDPFGRYKDVAAQFYQNPQAVAQGLAIGASDRPEFLNTLQNAMNGDVNATRRAMNDINAGRASSETPIRPEYRAFLGDYGAAMAWTKGDMKAPLSGNRFSPVLDKANDLRQTAEHEFPKAQAAVQNWSADSKTHQAPNGRIVADVGEMDFQTQSQRQILGAFKITTEYVLNAGARPADMLNNYLMRTQISEPYNNVMRDYAKGYAALGSNPDPARVQALQDQYIENARQQARGDLGAHGRDIDRNAVARDLKSAGQQEVGRINQEIQAQVMGALEEIPDAGPSSTAPQYRQQQPGMHLTN